MCVIAWHDYPVKKVPKGKQKEQRQAIRVTEPKYIDVKCMHI